MKKPMNSNLFIYTNPEDADVALVHDSSFSFVGSPVLHEGRPAHLLVIEGVPDGWGATLIVSKKDFTTVEQRGIIYLNRGNLVEFVVDDVKLVPFESRPLPALTVRGQFFQKANGDRFTAIQASDFNLLARYSRGEDIKPVLAQRRDAGFNMLRVWTLMHLSQFGIGDLDPCPYNMIPSFLRLCSRYGLYVELTAYTSTRDPLHWFKLVDSVEDSTNVILELVNENDQVANHINTDNYAKAPKTLCSHGSNGSQAQPVEPFWDYATFHTNDAPEWQRKVGHNAMEIWNGPTLSNENTRCPDRFTSLMLAYDSAAGAALLCAGSCFHSVHGKNSTLWEGQEFECAKAWAEGAKSVPLGYQDGRYNHPIQLEGPDILRAYQRILDDGRSWTVLIRK